MKFRKTVIWSLILLVATLMSTNDVFAYGFSANLYGDDIQWGISENGDIPGTYGEAYSQGTWLGAMVQNQGTQICYYPFGNPACVGNTFSDSSSAWRYQDFTLSSDGWYTINGTIGGYGLAVATGGIGGGTANASASASVQILKYDPFGFPTIEITEDQYGNLTGWDYAGSADHTMYGGFSTASPPNRDVPVETDSFYLPAGDYRLEQLLRVNISGHVAAGAYVNFGSVVPEPISSILFITGGTLLASRRYLRRKA